MTNKLAVRKYDLYNGSLYIEVIDLDETKNKRALIALRRAIKETDFTNKEIYASNSYLVIDGYARTSEINKDLAIAIINNLAKKFELTIKEF